MQTPHCVPNATVISYTLLRHLGLMLDELSAQGLMVRVDDGGRWYWQWVGTDLSSHRGFWAIGEAIVDAVIARFPDGFATCADES